MISYIPSTSSYATAESVGYLPEGVSQGSDSSRSLFLSLRWLVLGAAVFLVSVPVFIQAPLVRGFPLLSLLSTAVLIFISRKLLLQPRTHLWGDLLLGFTWTWLAGSVYWGWMRWEPFLHLPIEAIGLPFAIWGIRQNQGKIGNFFYLGSLLGTAITDIYFYVTNLIPSWRAVMLAQEDAVQPIFQEAIAHIQTPWGIGWALIFASLLVLFSLLPLRSQRLHWWAFSGAVLSTILVDGLFWLAASFA